MQTTERPIIFNMPLYRTHMIPLIVKGVQLAGFKIPSVTVYYEDEDSGELKMIKDDNSPTFPSIQWLEHYNPKQGNEVQP